MSEIDQFAEGFGQALNNPHPGQLMMSEEDQIQAAIRASLEQDQTYQNKGADEERKE